MAASEPRPSSPDGRRSARARRPSTAAARRLKRLCALAAPLSLVAACHQGAPRTAGIGDARAGAEIVSRQACGSCHRIPGVALADGNAGPPLEGIGGRAVLAGTLPNSTANMVRWLRDPQRVEPGTAMPDTGLSEREARDVAAFLYTLR